MSTSQLYPSKTHKRVSALFESLWHDGNIKHLQQDWLHVNNDKMSTLNFCFELRDGTDTVKLIVERMTALQKEVTDPIVVIYHPTKRNHGQAITVVVTDLSGDDIIEPPFVHTSNIIHSWSKEGETPC